MFSGGIVLGFQKLVSSCGPEYEFGLRAFLSTWTRTLKIGINPTTQLSSEVSLDWTNATKQPAATQDGSQKCARHKSRPDSLLDVNDKPRVSFFEESLERQPRSHASSPSEVGLVISLGLP